MALLNPACERSSTGTVSNVVYIARLPRAMEALAPVNARLANSCRHTTGSA